MPILRAGQCSDNRCHQDHSFSRVHAPAGACAQIAVASAEWGVSDALPAQKRAKTGVSLPGEAALEAPSGFAESLLEKSALKRAQASVPSCAFDVMDFFGYAGGSAGSHDGTTAQLAGAAPAPPGSESSGDFSEDSASDGAEEEGEDELYFSVRALEAPPSGWLPTEMDVISRRCTELRRLLRRRPTLPLSADGVELTGSDLSTGTHLPLYSCHI